MDTVDTIPSNVEVEFDSFNDLSRLPEGFEEYLIGIRRHFHQNPEIGLHEFETSATIRAVLEKHGMTVQGPFATTGICADIKGDFPGPVIAYRADMDALPIQDLKDVAYASKNTGLAHLCGHDAHTTIGIGVALLLNRLRHLIHGTVRVFFQPNEEGIPSGAPLMIQDGVLEDVEAAFAVHVDPTVHVGTFGVKTGAITASADRFRIVVHGPSTGHSARPHQTADTIWIGTQILNSLYQVVGRMTDARHSSVLTVTRAHAGEAYNVIPSSVEYGGTLRCTVVSDIQIIMDQIEKTSRAIATSYGARVDVDFDDGAPPVMNDVELADNVRSTIRARLGNEAIYEVPVPSMGAEDFAHYLKHVPGLLLRVGTSSGPSTSFPLHDACFDIDEQALAQTASLMAAVLISTLHSKAPALG